MHWIGYVWLYRSIHKPVRVSSRDRRISVSAKDIRPNRETSCGSIEQPPQHGAIVIDCNSCARYLLLMHWIGYVWLYGSIHKPVRVPSRDRRISARNGRNGHYQEHARHDRNQATAHHYRRQLPHLRSQINPDTILRLAYTQITTLQTAEARQSARKAKKRPK